MRSEILKEREKEEGEWEGRRSKSVLDTSTLLVLPEGIMSPHGMYRLN